MARSNAVLQTIIIRKEAAPTPTKAMLLARKYGKAVRMYQSTNTWRLPQLPSTSFKKERWSERPQPGVILVYGELINARVVDNPGDEGE